MEAILITILLLLVTSVRGQVLRDPGPLCPGQTVTIICDTSGGTRGSNGVSWSYNGVLLATIVPGTSTLPASRNASGVEFTLLDTEIEFMFLISFVASDRMSGNTLDCVGNGLMSTVTLQVEPVTGPPSNVVHSDSIHGIEQSDVTIEWTPPPNGGNDVMYTIGTTPAPLSGAMSVTTSSTQTTITVRHNTIYTVTVGVNTTCAGVQEATGTIEIAGCPRPLPPMDGSIIPFPATNEGAEIVYHCDPGFQPQSNVTAICASNGLWTPDPAQHQCIADCGVPAIPSNASVLGDVSSTTENAIVTFQCEEGLIPSHPITITCTRNGQWSPDPAGVQCTIESKELGNTTTEDMDSLTSGSVNLTTTSESTGLIAGVVVVVVALIATAVVVVIIVIVICSRNKSTRKNITSNTGLELQEAPIMEYNTISSRGYEPDITKDEYSTVRRDHSAGDPTKSPRKPPFSAEYSLLQTSDPTSDKQENGHGGLVYADIGVPKHKKDSAHQPMPAAEDRVVYSAIDTKATAKQQQKLGPNPDASLDLNMMLIQVRAVIPSWFPFGEALGVPVEVLKEVQGMVLEDYDKLVEVLDYWFRAFPKGTQPTWRTVAMALQTVGLEGLSADIMKVYTTGQLPISVSEEVPREAYAGESLPPPPLPPKVEESVSASLPRKPAPRSESLENGPPRPPKTNMSQISAPPLPPKSSLALQPAAPARPPKPGYV